MALEWLQGGFGSVFQKTHESSLIHWTPGPNSPKFDQPKNQLRVGCPARGWSFHVGECTDIGQGPRYHCPSETLRNLKASVTTGHPADWPKQQLKNISHISLQGSMAKWVCFKTILLKIISEYDQITILVIVHPTMIVEGIYIVVNRTCFRSLKLKQKWRFEGRWWGSSIVLTLGYLGFWNWHIYFNQVLRSWLVTSGYELAVSSCASAILSSRERACLIQSGVKDGQSNWLCPPPPT